MGMEIDFDEIDESKKINSIESTPAVQTAEDPVTEVAVEAIKETEVPSPRDKIEADVTADPPANAEKIHKTAIKTLPYPAKETLMLALAKEAHTAQLLKKKEETTDAYMAKIDKLLDLTSDLSALPQGEKVTFTDKIKTLLAELKDLGTDLWKEENTVDIATDKVTELKALIGSQTSKNQTKLQLELTKMQRLANDLMAILECAKGICRDDKQEKNTYTRNQRVSA